MWKRISGDGVRSANVTNTVNLHKNCWEGVFKMVRNGIKIKRKKIGLKSLYKPSV